jgi:hypothetical protein
MTDIQLSTAALGYAHSVGTEASVGFGAHLEHMALDFAGRAGSLDAAERAELLALRRFRDGIVSLRAEITEHGDCEHEWIAETIDAFFTLEGVGSSR